MPVTLTVKEHMSKPLPPRLLPHHGYKSWTTTWYDAERSRRTKRFGRQGQVSAKEARALYDHWMSDQFKRLSPGRSAAYTVAELAVDFATHAATVYRKNGELTTHKWQIGAAMKALADRFGNTAAAALEAPQLAALRDAMVYAQDAKGKPRTLGLKTVNGRLHIIKQAYQWARERGLVPRETTADVLLVKPLLRGRSKANDPEPVRPVSVSVVAATARQCPRVLRAMIRVQWLTGMRPGEVCVMRPADIDRSKPLWVYRPHIHKLEHKEKDRWVVLGRKAQAVLRPFLDRGPLVYLFSPAEATAERRAKRAKNRKTPLSCGNRAGTGRGRQSFAPAYSDETFRRAVHRATAKADKVAHARHKCDDVTKVYVPQWNPNQIRHSWATRVRRDFGVEFASVGLGHSNLSTTEIYAERSMVKAAEVADRIG